MIKGRVIAIGDVHGCHAELEKLLNLLSLADDDYVVFLGDLVNRGPDSSRAIELARSVKGETLLGNHELRLLTARRENSDDMLRSDDLRTIKQLKPRDWRYMESMKLHYELPDSETVLVHGGFMPGKPWRDQPVEVVTRIQVIDKKGRPQRRRDCPDGVPWADLWQGPPFVIYGHTPRTEIYERPGSLGIDTSCAMGGCLTACILPERKVVQVPAAEKYS